MKPALDFKGTKTRIIIAMYESLVSDRGYTALTSEQISQLVTDLPSAYVSKAIDSLYNEDLLEYDSGDFSMSEEAILLVEQKLIADGGAVIPAADRLVSIDHNQPKAGEITSALEALEKSVVGNNDAFAIDPEARAAAIAEVSALRRLWESAYVRIDAFKARSQSVLTWVSEKAAATTLAEACKHLIKLILGW